MKLFTTHSELHKVLFLVLSVTFLFVYELSLEPLNGYAPNSHERRLVPRWDEFECQGHERQISSPLKMHCHALAANNVMQQQMGPFRSWRGGDGSVQRGCVRFMFGKTSLALAETAFGAHIHTDLSCVISNMFKNVGWYHNRELCV